MNYQHTLAITALSVVAVLALDADRPTYAASQTRPVCNAAWSNRMAEKARASPLVRDMAMRRDGFHLVVSRAGWASLKISERDLLVSAFDCAIAGPGYLRKIIVEDATGAALKTYTAIELHEARKMQP